VKETPINSLCPRKRASGVSASLGSRFREHDRTAHLPSRRSGRRVHLVAVLLVLLASLSLPGCVGIPDGVQPVRGFELARYLGTWYEVARLDHRFERGLSRVTANYTLRDDGGVRVVNRGFDAAEGEWKAAEGKAYFVESPDVGRLKVSFFGPFYAGYNVIALDKEGYRWALVSGFDTDYLWILAREPELAPEIQERLIAQARAAGFATDELIFVAHE
jgi:apolipoprotein D and lipocalin family protein